MVRTALQSSSRRPFTYLTLLTTLDIGSALLETGLFISHGIWMVRTRNLRKQAKAEDKSFDELAAQRVLVEGDRFKFAERPLHPYASFTWWKSRLSGRARRRSKSCDEETALPAPSMEPTPDLVQSSPEISQVEIKAGSGQNGGPAGREAPANDMDEDLEKRQRRVEDVNDMHDEAER